MAPASADEQRHDGSSGPNAELQQASRVHQPTRFRPPEFSSTATTSTGRPRTSQGFASSSAHRRSYQETVPALPAIPARFLRTGRPASIGGPPPESPTSPKRSRRNTSRGADIIPDAALRVEKVRGSARGRHTDGGRASKTTAQRASWNANDGVSYARLAEHDQADIATYSPSSARRKSLPPPATSADGQESQDASATEDMARRGRAKEEDLFLELAQDDDDESGARPPSRHERVASRLSEIGKRRSLPPVAPMDSSNERRPKSSGNVFPRTSSRLSGLPTDLQRHVDRYRQSPGRAEDTMSVSGRSVSGRAGRFGSAPDVAPAPSRLAERMRSPELPLFGRRRPSYGAPLHESQQPGKTQGSQDESLAESSEPKHSLPDSASVESTADTVWDELDELKSRIKKLELTGKLPATSGAAVVSGDSSDRPRTATTAPTTIESSPKHERKPEAEVKVAVTEAAVGGPNAANIHPLLHAALTKAKPLLNGPLYRSLEATAADALQLAAMTGSAGPQGTTFSAASIINGATASDRHVRRKADTMCRNLTDLTLALCEGKHEAPSAVASPIVLEPLRKTPSIRSSRSRLGRGGSPGGPGERPMSRLEARRTSILGIPPTGSVTGGSTEDVSASEQETTPSHSHSQPRRTSRASSRLLSARIPRYDDVSGDDDPTIRPPSRAMTDIGNLRSRAKASREQDSPGQGDSPSLRSGMLAARRANGGAFETNREQSRVMSLNVDAGRRRWTKESTPPVMEEEMGDSGEFQASSQPKRRVMSLSQFGARREPPSRVTSLSQRRQALAD